MLLLLLLCRLLLLRCLWDSRNPVSRIPRDNNLTSLLTSQSLLLLGKNLLVYVSCPYHLTQLLWSQALGWYTRLGSRLWLDRSTTDHGHSLGLLHHHSPSFLMPVIYSRLLLYIRLDRIHSLLIEPKLYMIWNTFHFPSDLHPLLIGHVNCHLLCTSLDVFQLFRGQALRSLIQIGLLRHIHGGLHIWKTLLHPRCVRHLLLLYLCLL